MKVLWNDTVLDTDTATANNDGSFTWDYHLSSLTYFPERDLMCCVVKLRPELTLPIIYKKQTK